MRTPENIRLCQYYIQKYYTTLYHKRKALFAISLERFSILLAAGKRKKHLPAQRLKRLAAPRLIGRFGSPQEGKKRTLFLSALYNHSLPLEGKGGPLAVDEVENRDSPHGCFMAAYTSSVSLRSTASPQGEAFKIIRPAE